MHSRCPLLCGAVATALMLAGCATAGSSSEGTSPGGQPLTTGSASGAGGTATTSHSARRRRHRAPAHPRTSPEGPAHSTAPGDRVQRQPAPGSCHARGSGRYSEPDPRCTPGALNPAVTQATIDTTICVSGWTSTIRPPESVTEDEKRASLAAYGDSGPLSDYEYDHLVSLELGGAVNDPRNLWPEPGASPNPKDAVENELHDAVCGGRMSLAAAQHVIATDWVGYARSHGASTGSAPSRTASTGAAPSHTASAPPPSAGGCTVSGTYNSRYHDYDVYVHSQAPNATVTVTDSVGRSARWHTDSSGYADVYLKTGGPEGGQSVTATVGGTACHGPLVG